MFRRSLLYVQSHCGVAAVLIPQAVRAEGCTLHPIVLYADTGYPIRGATMKTTLKKLGITASYSRPRVNNDDPSSEALFRTCKYRPDGPTKGFATRADAQAWVAVAMIMSLHSLSTWAQRRGRQQRLWSRGAHPPGGDIEAIRLIAVSSGAGLHLWATKM